MLLESILFLFPLFHFLYIGIAFLSSRFRLRCMEQPPSGGLPPGPPADDHDVNIAAAAAALATGRSSPGANVEDEEMHEATEEPAPTVQPGVTGTSLPAAGTPVPGVSAPAGTPQNPTVGPSPGPSPPRRRASASFPNMASWLMMLPLMMAQSNNAASSSTSARPDQALSVFAAPPMFCPNESQSTSKKEPKWAAFLDAIMLRIKYLPANVTPMNYLWTHLDPAARAWATSMQLTADSDFTHACNVLAAGPWDLRDPLDLVEQMRTVRLDWRNPAKFISYMDQAFATIATAIAIVDPNGAIVPDWVKIFLILSLLPTGLREYMRRVPATRERWASYSAFKATFEALTFDTIRTMCHTQAGPSTAPKRSYSHTVQATPSTSSLRLQAKPFKPTTHPKFKPLPDRKPKFLRRPMDPQRSADLTNAACFKCHMSGHKAAECPNRQK